MANVKWTDKYPEAQGRFDYSPPAPAVSMGELGGQEALAEDPGERLVSVAIEHPWLDHLMVIVFDPAAAEEARASYPGASLWSAEAFKRFLDDARGLPDLVRRQLLVSTNLVKSVFGGSYRGMAVHDQPPKRKR